MSYELIEHTADLAVKARGKDFAGLVNSALQGLSCLIAESEPLTPDTYAEIVAEGHDREEILVALLNKALRLFYEKGALCLSLESYAEEKKAFNARVKVASTGLNTALKTPAREIKAATFHKLEVKEVEGNLEAIIIFDV